MTKTLTPAQKNLMDLFRRLPKGYRVNGVVGGSIKSGVLNNYDARAWGGLFSKGFLRWTETGFAVVED